MALVTKNDVTQIFAIQAPSIDFPPTFANYPRGWDTARTNNGKPTIKQFNYIQQRTDQNLLWIHQNGAALPYDATMEYAENATVVKDGELQKKQGASWVIPYLGKSNNLDDVPDKATARNNLEVMSATDVNTAISNATPTIPDATETVAGKAKIATTAIAQAGTNDTDFITAKKLRDALNATGEAPISACRAWVSFDGTTNPPTILNSSNVSSITQNSTGDWTINFTTAMPHSNYAPVLGFNDTQSGSGVFKIKSSGTAMAQPQLKTTTQLSVCFGGSGGGYFGSFFSVGVFC